MTSSLKAALDTTLRQWLDAHCEHEDRPDGFVFPQLAYRMAEAAALVYDTSFESSQYTEREVT